MYEEPESSVRYQSKPIPNSLSTVRHSAAKIEYQSNLTNSRVQAKLFTTKNNAIRKLSER